MNLSRLMRAAGTLMTGAMLLQLPGCQDISLLEILNTAFLGVTAAGSLVILENL